MIVIAVDARLTGAPLMVADAVRDDLSRVAPRDLVGTVYLGLGSTDLIGAADAHPHVMVPLSNGRRLDAVARAQLAHADGVVTMDEVELRALAPLSAPGATLMAATAQVEDQGLRVIRTANPFDAAEVQAFRRDCPAIAGALDRHRVPLEPFSPRRITLAVLEALVAASEPQPGGHPLPPRIDSSR